MADQLSIFDELKRARNREYSRRYRAAHPERIQAKYKQDPDRYKANNKRWRTENPEKYREWRRRSRREKPDAWAARDLDADHARRARIHGTFVEKIRRLVVFERDHWLCGICGEQIDRASKAPHPLSPSIDHIIPLSKGGEHSYDNVQAAHFYCNSIKSDSLEEAG